MSQIVKRPKLRQPNIDYKPKPVFHRNNPNPWFQGVKTTSYDFLNPHKIIRGIKPKIKKDEIEINFDKSRPIDAYNFPHVEYTTYLIKGIRKDPMGHKHPLEFEHTVPTGTPLHLPNKPGVVYTHAIPRQHGGIKTK